MDENKEPVFSEVNEITDEIKEEIQEKAEELTDNIQKTADDLEDEIDGSSETAAEPAENEVAKAAEEAVCELPEAVENNEVSESSTGSINEWPSAETETKKETVKEAQAAEKVKTVYVEKPVETVKTVYVEKPAKKGKMAGLMALWLALTVALCGATGYYASKIAAQKVAEQMAAEIEKNTVIVENTSSNTPSTITVYTSDLSEIVEQIEDTVVEIYTESVQYNRFYGEYVTSGAGSGVIISADGYIITNNHVIEGASEPYIVTLRNGETYEAKLVGTDEQVDIAVIKIEASGLKAATLGTSSTLKVGEACIAIGNPLGTLGGSVTSGIISALSREITIDGQKMTLLQTNADINPGNSGGGLFNLRGELIAVVNAKSTGDDIEGIGFAIPIDIAKDVAYQLITKGYVSRPMLGIRGISIETERYRRYYEVNNYGVLVSEITGSNAKAAGLQEGDLIIGIDEKTISSFSDLSDFLAGKQVGDEVTLTVERNGKTVQITFTLEEKTN